MTHPRYIAITARNFRKIHQIRKLSSQQLEEIEVVAKVFPFKSNNYVVNNLIDWENAPTDPMFLLNFPQRAMLNPINFEILNDLIKRDSGDEAINAAVNEIRLSLNPHPAGQIDLNVPTFKGKRMHGIQHKYRETVLFFPSQGQTCHAYCTFCFRWPQFVGLDSLKFASREANTLVEYLKAHKEVTNILYTGGDPMVMKANILARYIEPLLVPELEHIHTIRIGTKALAYWPYRFTDDSDSAELLALFKKVHQSGKQLTIMAHFNHPIELKTDVVKKAILNIRNVNAVIRTQSPLLRHINDDADTWMEMWRNQIKLGCIPYYMFLVRDTGAHHYFSVALEKAWQIYRNAYTRVSGIARTVRGPNMSASPGKIHLLGITEINKEKIFVLQFLQGRNPEWVRIPFFAKYNPDATWLDDLIPAFGEEKFFWQKEYEREYLQKNFTLDAHEEF